ncbi:MAG: histidine kinase [Butyrivibrio sp.]|nr:histidine kinase [Butyrivibrio sp.]
MISFLAATIALVVTIIIFAITSIKTFQEQSAKSSATLLDFYAQELENQTSDLQNIVMNIHSSNTSFSTLSSGSYSNNEKITLDYQLRTHINGSVRYGSILMAFSENDEVSIWQVGAGYDKNDFNKNYQLEKSLETFINELPLSSYWRWNLYDDGENVLLILPYKKDRLCIAAGIDLSKFAAKDRNYGDSENYEISFFNESKILTNKDAFAKKRITIDELQNSQNDFFTKLHYIVQSTDVQNMPVRLAGIMPVSKYIVQYRPFLLLMFVAFILLAILIMGIFEFLLKILVYPLDKISEASQILSDPQNTNELPESDLKFDIQEINQINDALSSLVKQKVSLARENESRKAEKEHAQLQYFQLQTRSHFFINCLKSLYNMLEMGEYDKMRRMIMNFSDHIRFIFHDNLSLITLKDELNEVNDYANIIQTDSSTPIMLIQKVPQELLDCMVPPLLIQTFLENAVKYNAQYHKMLQFVIEGEIAENNEKKYLRLRLSDNGTGYEEDMLEKLNFDADSEYEQYHVGISNLKRRMQILYHGDCNLAFFNNQENGGAMIMIYIPVTYPGHEE